MAARILAEEGVTDYGVAKRKAAARLGLPDSELPDNRDIEMRLREHLALFHEERQTDALARLRGIALEAMAFLEIFRPMATGVVVAGGANATSPVELHLTAGTVEEVSLWMDEHRLPHTQIERRLRFGGGREARLPCLRFLVDGSRVDLVVFPPRQAFEAPYCPITGEPIQRKNRAELARLSSAPR